jgi:mRNA-degrading endonuclease RelE of RelBE toxin-antitoxin system
MWVVRFTNKADKQVKELHEDLQLIVNSLTAEIGLIGPHVHTWKNFGKLKGSKNEYHCHIKSGRPTYVVCWRADASKRIVEVTYVGTHEKAPY